MSKYDSEDLRDDVKSIMTTDLNTKIAAIEAEKIAKGKGLTGGLAAIDSTAYFEQTWSDKICNMTPAIFYGIENVEAIDGSGVAAKKYTVFCEIIVLDTGQDSDAHRRVARYSRALEDLFAEKFDALKNASKIKIETVRPIAFKLEQDSSEEYKVGGVSLTIALC